LQRIALLVDEPQQQQLHIGDEINDEIWLNRILESTSSNPHGIRDENSLSKLLEEVQYWTCGKNLEQTTHSSLSNDNYSPLLSPGGSSSGAAVAACHGSCLLSIGTDTGGSLRLPAAWTSTVGFKPTYGTWSRYGVVNYASSLDTLGFVTRTTECAEIAWRCLRSSVSHAADESSWNGQLSRDSTSMVYHVNKTASDNDDGAHRSFSEIEVKPLVNIRIGIPAAFSLEETPPQIANAWSESASILQNVGGATLVTISDSKLSSELIKTALASYYVLACAEASSNLSRYDGVRYGMNLDFNTDPPESSDYHSLNDMSILERQISTTRVYGFGEETQRRILAGTSVLSSDRFHTHYEAAALARAMLSRSLNNVFRPSLHDNGLNVDGVDVILVPTALTFPPKLSPRRDNGVEMMDPTAAFANDVMTIPISLCGLPSISVPASRKVNVEGASPIGMQIVASRGSEDLILRVANVLDRC
jgi:aspartyl-tRNA(Asn)/glutamyl-tRNA(Gln) amidotransferase subunit A